MSEQSRLYGLDPNSDCFLEQLAANLHADGIIPELNMTLAQAWLDDEPQQAEALRADAGNSYVLTTWPSWSADPNPGRTSQSLVTRNKEAALVMAESYIPQRDVVGVLTSPDGAVVARRYVIICKADVGEGMRMHCGSWRFFAADDEAAVKVLEGFHADWANILYGPNGILARKS